MHLSSYLWPSNQTFICLVKQKSIRKDGRQVIRSLQNARKLEPDDLVSDDETGGQLRLVFKAGTLLCAVPLDHVVETMRALPIKSVSGVPRFVCGVSIVRGEPLAVVDIGLLIADQATRADRLVTVRTSGRMVAILAERVIGVYSPQSEHLKQMPPLLLNAATETIAAIGILDAELLLFLRGAQIIPADVLGCLDASGALL
jgi:purine-binding chemotaxis protein CheW